MKRFATLLLLAPLITSAHVKWFADSGIAAKPYSLFDTPVILGIAIAILIVGIFYILEKKFSISFNTSNKTQKIALTLADIGIGLSFLIFSYLGFVFTPNIIVEGSIGNILLIMQAIIGICYLFGIYTRWAALVLIFMYFGGVYAYGWVELMDVLEILGFGVYGFIAGHPKWKICSSRSLKNICQPVSEYAAPLLRVFIGLNLIVLGLSEKILRPDLGLEFLSQYTWNFTSALGFPISDYWFVFSAGSVEIIIGLLLLLGLMTRLTTTILAIFLIITLVLLGPMELIGHLPHFSLAIVLLVCGSGNKLKLG